MDARHSVDDIHLRGRGRRPRGGDKGLVPDNQHRGQAAKRPGTPERDVFRAVRHGGQGGVQQLVEREHAR